MFNWKSPVIDKQTFDAFRAREDLRASFQRAFKRIMNFYGFDVTSSHLDQPSLARSYDHLTKFRNWVVRMDQ